MFPLTTSRKSSLQEYPSLWARIQNMGWMLTRKTDKSLSYWLDLLKNNSGKPNLNVVRHLIQNQAFQEARDYLEGLMDLEENAGEIRYLLAQCYFGQGLIPNALQAVEKAIIIEPENAGYLELQADCLLEQGDWEGAVEALNKSLRANPKHVETIFRLGTIYSYHGQHHEALRCYQGCCELRPSKGIYWEMKAETHLQLHQIPQACVSFEKALKSRFDPDLCARLAYCYVQLNKIKKGIRYYQLTLKHEPDHYDALCNLAAVYQNQGRSLEALNLQERALRICSNDPILLNNLAYTLVQLGRNRKATEYYNQALKLAQRHPLIMYNLSVCYVQRGNWEAGIENLKQLLEIDPEHSEAWALLGNIYDQLTCYDLAIDCFNKALKLG